MTYRDTNICIGFLNEKDPVLRERLAATSPDEVRLCAIVKAELLYGARNSTRVDQDIARLTQLFELFGSNDMLIAAIALAADLTLVTRDQDEFHHIGGLRLETW